MLLAIYVSLKSFPLTYVDGNLLVNPDKMVIDAFSYAGQGMGFFIGWFCERRLIKFKVDGDWYKRVIRFVVGAFVILILNFIVNSIFVQLFGSHWGTFVSRFLTSFFIMAIYPFIFSKFESYKLAK